ncbi:sn-glycerol-3-phosphate ABC transporter ATP-binding protein UgpC [Robertmurraya massiliosenegalensis]|uniref:ABC transporter ATP-binding protein n=1 Tax=Robertmurraya TaxID=2837507 RepID=UPI0039A457D0
MPIIELKKISKSYDQHSNVIEDFNLSIEQGEFVVFLGPSGCGKSTTLRMIAGLESITNGDLFIKGKRQNDIPAKNRDIAMVFQSYALYPHMTVFENIGFGLRVRKVNKRLIKEKVEQAAELLNLTPFLKRKPKDLSGGQMQRVALGRALVRDTDIFLMDEPLSNLDAKLRTTMREELVQLHRKLGATTIFVTHDQTEAMTMGDKIVILNNGKVQQIGKPTEIYHYPANLFVASFIGSPAMNLLSVKKETDRFVFASYPLETPDFTKEPQDLILGIRPEDCHISTIEGYPLEITFIEEMGSDQFIHGIADGQKVIIRELPDKKFQIGEHIFFTVNPEKISWFDKATGERLRLKLEKNRSKQLRANYG